jgi:hypothetical protein
MSINYPSAVEDAEQEGFFYVKTRDGLDREFPSDTTVYINYTGRLLNGRAFDTTVADTAKVWGLYSSSKTYAQQQVKWFSSDQDYTSITLGEDETSVIPGFAYGLSVMHPGEAGKCFFVSKYGYSGSGCGTREGSRGAGNQENKHIAQRIRGPWHHSHDREFFV